MSSSKINTISLFTVLLSACGGSTNSITINQYLLGDAEDSGTASDTAVEIITSNPCFEEVALTELPLDLWGDGNLFYFEVSEEQRAAMDAATFNYGNQYGLGEIGTYADNVRITPKNSTTCANTGKVALELAGQSSWRDWAGIPNLHLDVQPLEFPSGDHDLRLNNGQAESGVLREYTALHIWRALYFAPQTAFAKTQSNIWDTEFGAGTWAAHVAVQPYKGQFFSESLPDVQNVWEGYGDFSSNFGWGAEFECQWAAGDACDDGVLQNAIDVIDAAPYGEGFRAATEGVINWDAYNRYQCLTALTGAWDNYSHNWNNVVPAFDSTGKMLLLPYSTDISADHPWYGVEWYGQVFVGNSYIPNACAQDTEGCLRPMLDACKGAVDEFRALGVPNNVVDPAWKSMQENDLVRDGDEGVYNTVRTFYEESANRVGREVDDLLECLGDPVRGGGGGGDTGSPCWQVGDEGGGMGGGGF